MDRERKIAIIGALGVKHCQDSDKKRHWAFEDLENPCGGKSGVTEPEASTDICQLLKRTAANPVAVGEAVAVNVVPVKDMMLYEKYFE